MNHDLVALSNQFGSNPDYVLAGGGNTSFKNETTLWVKASGTRLSTITEKGFVAMDRAKIQSMWSRNYDLDPSIREAQVLQDLMEARLAKETGRPSVETALHEMLDYPLVLHLHPWMVNGLTCSQTGKAWCQNHLGDGVLWMDATKPGYLLAKNARDHLASYMNSHGCQPHTLLLENHGVFLGGSSIAQLKERMDVLIDRIRMSGTILPPDPRKTTDQPSPETLRILHNEFPEKTVLFHQSELSDGWAPPEVDLSRVDHAFTPDHLVYCGPKPLLSSVGKLPEAIFDFRLQMNRSPKVIIIPGEGLYAVGETSDSAELILDVYLDAAKIGFFSQNFGGPKRMDQDDIDFILNWEVEQYRAKATATHHE